MRLQSSRKRRWYRGSERGNPPKGGSQNLPHAAWQPIPANWKVWHERDFKIDTPTRDSFLLGTAGKDALRSTRAAPGVDRGEWRVSEVRRLRSAFRRADFILSHRQLKLRPAHSMICWHESNPITTQQTRMVALAPTVSASISRRSRPLASPKPRALQFRWRLESTSLATTKSTIRQMKAILDGRNCWSSRHSGSRRPGSENWRGRRDNRQEQPSDGRVRS